MFKPVKLICPECNYMWEYNYLQWLFKTPFHEYVFFQKRDYRKTTCPNCGKKSWISRKK